MVGLLAALYWMAMMPPTTALAVVRVSSANTKRRVGGRDVDDECLAVGIGGAGGERRRWLSG